MDSDRYLNTQIARAICKAAYEKPLTIEEISIAARIPAMYIEDELPRLEYGDAICKIGFHNKIRQHSMRSTKSTKVYVFSKKIIDKHMFCMAL